MNCPNNCCVRKCTFKVTCLGYLSWTDCSTCPKGCSYYVAPEKCGC